MDNKLNQLCEFPLEQEWKLVYRATRDGFSSDEFHYHCVGIANTLSIIKSEHGNVFGGFAEKKWVLPCKNSKWIEDRNAFIFSLINKDNEPFKAKLMDDGGKKAIYSSSCRGLGFGEDFFISSYSNSNSTSSSNFGVSYKHPNYHYGSDKAKMILAGSYHFLTTEIEVFTKIK